MLWDEFDVQSKKHSILCKTLGPFITLMKSNAFIHIKKHLILLLLLLILLSTLFYWESYLPRIRIWNSEVVFDKVIRMSTLTSSPFRIFVSRETRMFSFKARYIFFYFIQWETVYLDKYSMVNKILNFCRILTDTLKPIHELPRSP